MTLDALAAARAYHQAWTTHDYDGAAALLAESLSVEVPINEYPTTDSFVAALRRFGSMTRRVDLLSSMCAGDEAMLLYDMEVEGLDILRVVEHFTVRNGRIVRLRQVHDTTAMRNGRLAVATPVASSLANAGSDDFRADIIYAAPTSDVFDALANPGGANGWWTTDGGVVTGVGDELTLNWSAENYIVFRVDSAERPTAMRWTCVAQHDTNLPQPDEWVGTELIFRLAAEPDGSTRMLFEHRGLTPRLDCFGVCEGGWDHFLRCSIRQLVASGKGLPYTVPAQ